MRAVLARRGGDGEGVDGEGGSDGVVGTDIVKGVAGHRTHRDAVHQHIRHMVAGARGDGEGLVSTVVHGYCTGWGDACRSRPRGGDGEGVDGEGGGDGVVGS